MSNLEDDPRFIRHTLQLQRKGLRGDRILGGTPVPAGVFPDCVAVGCRAGWFCSGTLVAPAVVVTAGHCAGCAEFVYFGDDVRGVDPDPGRNPAVVSVKDRIRHDDYVARERNDLMILILAVPVTVPPPRLATGAQIDAATDGRAAGFGWVDLEGRRSHGRKLMVDVPIASHACRGRIRGRSDAAIYGCAPGLELVARRKDRVARDTCKGDSGGPLYVQVRGGAWRLAAATSRGTWKSPRLCGDGGIYTRLDRYKDWIEDTARVRL